MCSSVHTSSCISGLHKPGRRALAEEALVHLGMGCARLDGSRSLVGAQQNLEACSSACALSYAFGLCMLGGACMPRMCSLWTLDALVWKVRLALKCTSWCTLSDTSISHFCFNWFFYLLVPTIIIYNILLYLTNNSKKKNTLKCETRVI